VIPNEKLLAIVERRTSILDAFRQADDVLRQGVQGITDLITIPGLINLDFADVRTIMTDAGSALMGIGTGSGEDRAAEAARNAISSPLLEENVEGATGILLNITGGRDLGLFEVNEAAEIVQGAADSNANIIFGAVLDETQGEDVRVTVIATGFDHRGRGIRGREAERPRGRDRSPRIDDRQRNSLEIPDDEIDIPPFLRGEPGALPLINPHKWGLMSIRVRADDCRDAEAHRQGPGRARLPARDRKRGGARRAPHGPPGPGLPDQVHAGQLTPPRGRLVAASRRAIACRR
jgi:hypothetical protein